MNFVLLSDYNSEISKKWKFTIVCIALAVTYFSLKCLETLMGRGQFSQPEHKNILNSQNI